MIPQKTIEDLIHRHSKLEKDLSSGSLDKKLRAYSSINGEVLWEFILPHQSFVAPTTYVRDNEQYLIVIATGGGVLKKKYPKLVSSGDTYISFKLKNND